MHNNNSRFASLVDDTFGSHKSVFGKNKSKKDNEKKDNEKKDNEKKDNEKKDNEKKDNEKKDIKPVTINKSVSSNFFKNDRSTLQMDNYRRPYGSNKEYIEMLEKQKQFKKAEEEKIKEEEKMAALSMECFPELSKVTTIPLIVDNTKKFIEKIKTCIKDNDIQVHHIVKPGWIEMRRDPKTNKIIIEKGVIKKTLIKTQEDIAYNVFDELAYLHEKRTSEYINNWGEDEWERTFLFSNYDYHYFDKLDEIYEKNNPKLEEEYGYFLEDEFI